MLAAVIQAWAELPKSMTADVLKTVKGYSSPGGS
jgi:hypothetical protein